MKQRSGKFTREMRDDYDFTNGVRGKYARRHAKGANVVVLEPNLAKVFSDSKRVNLTLRKLIRAEKAASAK